MYNQLQFAGDWTINYKFTSIKGVGLNETQGVPDAALMRSIEGYAQVDNYRFNIYDPDKKPANETSDPQKPAPSYTENYRDSERCQQICYERRLMAKELDNSPQYIIVGTKSASTTIWF